MQVKQKVAGGDVTLTLSLDQTLAIAALMANVGDREAGPLVGLYDAIGDCVEYGPQGWETSFSLYEAVDRKREFVEGFIAASARYLNA